MNKNVIIGLVVIFIIIILSGLKMKSASDADVTVETPQAIEKGESDKYIEYVNPETLETKNSKVVLYFFANWCPTCIPADKEFKANGNKIPDGVTVIRINYNDPDTDRNEKLLSKKYGITYQHTFVQIDEYGNEITKWNGGAIDELLSNIK